MNDMDLAPPKEDFPIGTVQRDMFGNDWKRRADGWETSIDGRTILYVIPTRKQIARCYGDVHLFQVGSMAGYRHTCLCTKRVYRVHNYVAALESETDKA